MEQIIQIEQENHTPLSIHGINKQITSQTSVASNCIFPQPNTFGASFQSNENKQHIETLYIELNNMRSNIDKCNKTLDNVYYSNNLVHTEYNNLCEYYNNIIKSINNFYESLRYLN